MTGHGAHAFNQTYQRPRRHPVILPAQCSPTATLTERVSEDLGQNLFGERNPMLEEETVKVASFPNFDKKRRLKTTSRSSLGMEKGGRQKRLSRVAVSYTWKGGTGGEKSVWERENYLFGQIYWKTYEFQSWVKGKTNEETGNQRLVRYPKFHAMHSEGIRAYTLR